MTNDNRKLSADTTLFLVHTSGEPDTVNVAITRAASAHRERMPWLFLGRSYTELLAWHGRLDDRFVRISIGRDLEQVSSRLRQPFLSLITELGRSYASIAWWTSRISERNGWVSPLFVYCCYLHIGSERIDTTAGPLCIMSESWAVLRSLDKIAREKGRSVRWLTPPTPSWRLSIQRCARMAIDACRFLKRRTIASRVARRIRSVFQPPPPNDDRPRVLIRTFIDDGCLHKDGTFHDRYFPGLGNWLEKQGCDVWNAPVLFNMKRSYTSTWSWLHDCSPRFLNPDCYYRLTDILFTIWHAFRQSRMPHGNIRLGDFDVTKVFNEERQRIAFDHDSLRWILISRLPLRLKQAGISIDWVVQPYENMIPEKGTILGFRRHMPNTRIVGCQHSSLPPMLLCLFATQGETGFAPLPDKIVCNGKWSCDTLIREGLDAPRLVEGPALRYAYLWEDETPVPQLAADEECVLLALPIELEPAVELLAKTLHAIQDSGIHMRIKPHPLMSQERLMHACGNNEVSPHIEFVQEPMDQLLRNSSVVISAGSAVISEARIAGVPLVVVGREGDLNFNPLGGQDRDIPICHSPSEIRNEVVRLMNLDATERSDYRRRGKALLRDSFNPITDERMQAFLGK